MATNGEKKKVVRVFADGCYDMMHFGHANALRQAKALGDYLVVGVHSDAEIMKHKGPPVMPEKERYAAVRACKWVDEVIEDSPYIIDKDFLIEHNIDFATHGEDITLTADGKDVYQAIKDAGMMRTIKRTEGVSTTDIVGRMLLMTREHQGRNRADSISAMENVSSANVAELSSGTTKQSPYTKVCHFLPTTQKIVQFSEGKTPADGDRIVYIDGAWDLFHVGHINAIQQAKKEGDYLIVGIHTDEEVNLEKGLNYPIMTLHERVLSVLACRNVDEVVIGAPFVVNEEMVKQMKLSVVVHGNEPVFTHDGKDPYEVPKKLGIYKSINFTKGYTAEEFVARIIANQQAYMARNRSKEQRENAFNEGDTEGAAKKDGPAAKKQKV